MQSRFQKVSKSYKNFSLIFFNFFVIFLALNLSLVVFFFAKDRSFKFMDWMKCRSNLLAQTYGKDALRQVYPGMSDREIDDLLAETWTIPHTYDAFTQFKEHPRSGRYVNIDANGFRKSKNQGPWPPDSKYLNVFLFGGSTTFGYGVADDDTIASHLQEALSILHLKKPPRVYNFGRSTYYSTQERILFEKLLSQGATPDVAIFIDGVNDFYYKVYQDTPIYTETLTHFFDSQASDGFYFWRQAFAKLPISRAIGSLRARLGIKPEQELRMLATAAGLIHDKSYYEYVIRTYRDNLKMTEAVGSRFGVKTFFVWQPAPTYKYDLRCHLFKERDFERYDFYKAGYPMFGELERQKFFGENFIWAADIQENVKECLYVDAVHYTAKMSKMLAEFIARSMREKTCRGGKINEWH